MGNTSTRTITNLGTPVNPNDAASKDYVDTTSGGGGVTYVYHTFNINGTYGTDTFWDGAPVINENLNLVNIYVANGTTGASGTVTVDVLYATNQSTPSWTSVFTTKPTFTTTAASGSWCGVGDTVTGHTAGVLTSNPLALTAKTSFRLDTQGTHSGFGNLTVTLVFSS